MNSKRDWQYNHLCLEVEDIEEAATSLARTVGAGPFFLREKVSPDEISSPLGGPCAWEHSHALGALGGQLVELNQNHTISPPALARELRQRPIGHIAYAVARLDEESRRLAASGVPLILRSRTGPVELAYHQSPLAGAIELLQDGNHLRDLRTEILAAAEGWKGDRPVRLVGSADSAATHEAMSSSAGESNADSIHE